MAGVTSRKRILIMAVAGMGLVVIFIFGELRVRSEQRELSFASDRTQARVIAISESWERIGSDGNLTVTWNDHNKERVAQVGTDDIGRHHIGEMVRIRYSADRKTDRVFLDGADRRTNEFETRAFEGFATLVIVGIITVQAMRLRRETH